MSMQNSAFGDEDEIELELRDLEDRYNDEHADDWKYEEFLDEVKWL